MTKGKIPDPLERRHLIERELATAQASKIAEAYLAEGRRMEAVDFLIKAEDTEKLGELRREAIADGDVFLLRAVAAALEEEPANEEWSATADAAEAAGKEYYAIEARRQAEIGDGE